MALLIQSLISPSHLQEQFLHLKAKGSVRKRLVFACCAVSATELGLELPALKLTLDSTKMKTRLKPSGVGVPVQLLHAEQTIPASLNISGDNRVASPTTAASC